VWPIATAIRDHVIHAFQGLDLPVDLFVERKGLPHKLVMVKNGKLYKNAKEKFDKLRICYQKLEAISHQNEQNYPERPL